MNPFFIVETTLTLDQACSALEAAVVAHGFGVLGHHDLGATLRAKGLPFPEQCRVYEVCQPQQAARVLGADMRLAMALPCRIAVYTEDGQTRLGMVRPEGLLNALSSDPQLQRVAAEVEATTTAIIRQAAG
jgi:uncharacterized protein (DUF302 family)